MKIIFYSNSEVTYNPEILRGQGVGGAEVVLIEASKELAKRGHEVTVFNRCGDEAYYEDVKYRNIDNYNNDECDVFFGFESFPEKINAKKIINWSNRPNPIGVEKYPFVDQVICVSEFHKSILKSSPIYDKIVVIENGIEDWYFTSTYSKQPKSIIYAGYPGKGGMAILPSIMKKVREEHPDAVMRVCGAGMMWGHDNDKFQKLYQELKDSGIIYMGQVGSECLSYLFKISDILINPLQQWHVETYGLTIGQAMASRTLVISSGEGNLGNLIGNTRGFALYGELDDDWIDKASNLICAMFDNFDFKQTIIKNANRFIQKNNWHNAINHLEEKCLQSLQS